MSRRRSRHEPWVKVNIALDPTLYALFEEACWDPTLKRARYGTLTREFNEMLRRWLTERGITPPPPKETIA